MNKEKILEILNDISYDINGIWDDSIEDNDNRIDTIKSVLSFFKDDEKVKNELIDIIRYYVIRLYEELEVEE